jgi:hypothetical protein
MSQAREARGEDMVVRGISSASIEQGSEASFEEKELTEEGNWGLSPKTATGQDRNIRYRTYRNGQSAKNAAGLYPDELRSMHEKIYLHWLVRDYFRLKTQG